MWSDDIFVDEEALDAWLRTPGCNVNQTNDEGETPLAVACHRSVPAALRLISAGASVDGVFDWRGMTPLACAVDADDAPLVDALIAARVDVEQVTHSAVRRTALHFASSGPVVRALVAAGARVNVPDASDVTPLESAVLSACSFGESPTFEDAVAALLAAGADVHLHARDGLLLDAAVAAANVRVARMLLAAGARPTVVQSDAARLWLAVLCPHVGQIEALAAAGLDVDAIVEENGSRAIVAAAECGNVAAVQTLLRLGATSAVDEALEAAVEGGFDAVVDVFLATGAMLSDEHLAAAAASGHVGMVRKLLELDVDVDRGDALAVAARAGHEAVIEVLVAAGADLNRPCWGGVRPIGLAAREFQWGAVLLLAAKGALLTGDNDFDESPLLLAATDASPSAVTALSLLISAETDMQHLQQALDVSLVHGNVSGTATLLAAGVSPSAVTTLSSQWCHDAFDRRKRIVALTSALLAAGEYHAPTELRESAVAGIPAARKAIERAGFVAIRSRVLEIGLALHEMDLPAPLLVEIATASCAPFASQLPFHFLWDAMVLIKHRRF